MESEMFLPEARYQKTYLDDWVINPKNQIGKIVHVRPIEYSHHSKFLFVNGENFHGIIKLEDLTIYPLSFFEDRNIPRFLPSLFNHCITAKIIDYVGGDFILSRKESMKEALQYLKYGRIINAYITAFSNLNMFLDIGAGIEALCPLDELAVCPTYFKYSKDEYLNVKVLEESSSYKNKFIVSYKQLFSPKQIEKGDIVQGIASNWAKNKTGFYVSLSPHQAGIANASGLVIVEPSELNEVFNPDIVFGNTYSFYVRDISTNSRGQTHYHLSLFG